MSGRPTFETACAQYVHRFTCEHIPAWARTLANNGKFYAPQYATDREWYENTKFPGEPGHIGSKHDCYMSNQSWPLGQCLFWPFHRRHEVTDTFLKTGVA